VRRERERERGREGGRGGVSLWSVVHPFSPSMVRTRACVREPLYAFVLSLRAYVSVCVCHAAVCLSLYPYVFIRGCLYVYPPLSVSISAAAYVSIRCCLNLSLSVSSFVSVSLSLASSASLCPCLSVFLSVHSSACTLSVSPSVLHIYMYIYIYPFVTHQLSFIVCNISI
jgi:hypothetical protein